jgi:tetratricopeptide (TPR) repeat protein
MIACPPVEKWRRYLDDRLSRREDCLLTEHLEACRACEEMVAGLVTPCGAGRAAAGSPHSPPELAARLRGLWSAANPPEDSTALEQWPILEGYEILDVLGRGGMGVVYRAREEGLGREVALKMLAGGEWSTAADARRLFHDARMAAQLRHAHIVPVHAVGQCRGLPYCVMELIAGGSMAQRAADLAAEPREAARLVAAAARALHHAHLHGVCHRDVKPANILLRVRCCTPPSGESSPHPLSDLPRPRLADLDACVSDFGLARRTQDGTGLTQTGAIVGTPGYMAPEQIRSEEPTPAGDVFGLGAVLYECLTGQGPFRAATPFDTLLMTLHKEPERPRTLNSRLARDLETVCLKCLEKDPRRRYDSAELLAEDLERWLGGEPVRAKPSGPIDRAWRWCRRKPVIAGLAAALFLAVAGGFFASLLLWRQAVQNRDRAVAGEAQALANLKKEEAARHESEEHFEKLRDVLTKTIQPKMTRAIVTQSLNSMRHLMLLEAQPHLTALLQRRPADDELRELLGAVLTQLGAIDVLQAQDAGTRAVLERAADLWERWPEGKARSPENRAWLAITYAYLEQVYEREGRPERAQQAFASAFAVWQALSREPPEPPSGEVLVDADLDIGWVLLTEGFRGMDPSRRFEKVRDRLSRTAEPAEADLFFDLARVGYWHGEAEKPNPSRVQAEILTDVRQAASILKRLVPQAGLHPNTRRHVAGIALWICRDLRRGGAPEEALLLAQQTRRTLQELLRESPNDCGLHETLSQAWAEIAKNHWDLHQAEETLTACRNALESQRMVCATMPEEPGCKRGLMWRYEQLGRKLCELGRLDEAEVCFRERIKVSAGDPAQRQWVLNELRKWAAQVGKDKDDLSPLEQQERQRYLDLRARLELPR